MKHSKDEKSSIIDFMQIICNHIKSLLNKNKINEKRSLKTKSLADLHRME